MFKDLSTVLTELRRNFGEGVVMACRATEKTIVIEVIVFVEQDGETYQFSVLTEYDYGSSVDNLENWVADVIAKLDTEITQKLEPAAVADPHPGEVE
jgi:hypothetical protein